MNASNKMTWCTSLPRTWWRGVLLLFVTLLAGCYELESGVAILDVSNSRIPLAMHGVWVAPDGHHFRVIESKDGRIGQVYELERAESHLKISGHRLFLVARADDNAYLVSGSLGSLSRQFVDVVKLDGGALASTERRAKQLRHQTDELVIKIDDEFRENLLLKSHRMEQVPSNEEPRNSFTIGNGWGIRGDVTLQSMKAFVVDALTTNLLEFKATWNRLGRTRDAFAVSQQANWSDRDWAQFETLRNHFDMAERQRQQRVDELLASSVLSDDAKRQLRELVPDKGNVPQLESVGDAVRRAEVSIRVDGGKDLNTNSKEQAFFADMMLVARTRDAALGHTASQLWLGQRHEQRESREGLKALNAALRWYELAASSGNPEGAAGAKRVLGKLSSMGRQ